MTKRGWGILMLLGDSTCYSLTRCGTLYITCILGSLTYAEETRGRYPFSVLYYLLQSKLRDEKNPIHWKKIEGNTKCELCMINTAGVSLYSHGYSFSHLDIFRK